MVLLGQDQEPRASSDLIFNNPKKTSGREELYNSSSLIKKETIVWGEIEDLSDMILQGLGRGSGFWQCAH